LFSLIAPLASFAVSRCGYVPVVIGLISVVTLPMLIGSGAALKARYDVDHLYASNATLELENANYRAATEQLAGQIMALQTAMSDLGTRAALDPSLQKLDGQAAGNREEPRNGWPDCEHRLSRSSRPASDHRKTRSAC
jgi:hypothetical protein